MKERPNPNRMEMMKLRKRLVTAQRGHQLLKDKLEGLIKDFMEYLEGYKKARRELDAGLPEVLRLFILASLSSSRQVIESALNQSKIKLNLKVATSKIMGVQVPDFKPTFEPGEGYSYLNTPAELDTGLVRLQEYFPKILDIAQREQGILRLLKEIERTRRRVNALEYVTIPDMEEGVKEIRMKLEELERGSVTRLMKIKEMRLQQERRQQ